MNKSNFDRKVIESKIESPGTWIIKLECSHEMYSRTRKDAKKHPKYKFCSQCFSKNVVEILSKK